jgi:hypothetical protein
MMHKRQKLLQKVWFSVTFINLNIGKNHEKN